MTTTFQEDLVDEFNWTTIETTCDENGVMTGRTTVFDNDLVRFQDFADGVLRYMEQIDGEQDVRGWQSLETYYDPNGQLAARIETRDDGVVIASQYDAGVIRYSESVDLGPNGEASDAQAWERIETYYDENGLRDARIETRDDGVVIATQYEGGIRRYVESVDLGPNGEASDARTWERIETYYNENGTRDARIETRDDGVVIATQYEDGIRRYVESVDLSPNGEASDARNWERIETYYDENGQREAQFELRDNGITITSEYQYGTIRVQTQVDQTADGGTSDAAIWETNTAYYSQTGQLEAREVIYDNEDVTAMFFEDGIRSLRLQYDGDDSASWLVRETVYDEAGQVAAINTYDTWEEVPEEYNIFAVA